MRIFHCTLLRIVLFAPIVPIPVLAGTPSPTAAALQRMHELRPSRMGVDRHGNLWAWNRATGVTQWVTSIGEVQTGPVVRDASAVDVDSEWGVVALSGTGNELVYLPTDGGAAQSTPLPNQAGFVTWVGAKTVAISPKFAGHRVEIWDVGTRLLVFTIGDEAPIKPRVGAVMAHSVLLHFDYERERLATLEALSGDFQVFSLGGKPIYRSTLSVPDREREFILAWLQQSDRNARAAGESQTPSVCYFSDFALDRHGNAWAVGERSQFRDQTTFLVVRENGVADRISLETENCAAPQVAVWGEWLIQYADAAAPSPFCLVERRRP